MLNKFKENKKIMGIKMDQASKMADEAANEFIDSIYALVKDASEEDFKKFLQAEDDMIEPKDKLAALAAFADTHDDIDGAVIIGFASMVSQLLALAESKF